VVRVGRGRGAEDFGVDRRATGLGMLPLFENQDTGAFAHHEAVAVLVPGTAGASGVVIASGERAHGSESAHAHGRNGGFGASGNHDVGIAVLDEQGRALPILEPGTRILVRISVRATADVALPIVGFMLRNQLGMDFSGTNTAREGYELAALQAGDVTTVDFYLELPELYPASFSFSPAIADGTLMGYQMCDWIDNAITLQMGRSEAQVYGYVHLPCRVEVNGRIRTERPLENHLG